MQLHAGLFSSSVKDDNSDEEDEMPTIMTICKSHSATDMTLSSTITEFDDDDVLILL